MGGCRCINGWVGVGAWISGCRCMDGWNSWMGGYTDGWVGVGAWLGGYRWVGEMYTDGCGVVDVGAWMGLSRRVGVGLWMAVGGQYCGSLLVSD